MDNSDVRSSGLSSIGFQALKIEILEGPFRGETVPAVNNLAGQTDIENLFKKGDVIIAAIIMENGAIEQSRRWTSFGRTPFSIFSVFLWWPCSSTPVLSASRPAFLYVHRIHPLGIPDPADSGGAPPLITTTYTVILLSAVIIFLVAGIT